MLILQLALYFLIPIGLEKLAQRVSAIRAIGVVTVCYIAGLIMGNLPFLELDIGIAQTLIEGLVALAIPLLLFKTDFKLVRASGRNMTLAFLSCVVAVGIVATVATLLFAQRIDEPAIVGGMMTGVYTGGTLNMSAIGVALGASEDLFVLMNATDMLYGGVLLLFFLTVSFKVFSSFLPTNPIRDSAASHEIDKDVLSLRETPIAVVLGLFTVGIAIGISVLIKGSMDTVIVLLSLTTLALLASLIRKVHTLKGSFVVGNYLLYVFCVAVGSLASIQNIIDTGPSMLLYFAVVIAFTLLLYALFSRLLRIDVDSSIIASVAGFYGPAFIPPVARAIGAMYVVPLGIAFSLIGFAVGNYLGILVAGVIEGLIHTL